MREQHQHGRVLAVNGRDPEEWEAMTAAGVNLGPVRHVRVVVAGRWVDTTDVDHIPSEQDLADLAAVAEAGIPDPVDLETEQLLEQRHYDLGPADEEW
jgi:hypothetical protein